MFLSVEYAHSLSSKTFIFQDEVKCFNMKNNCCYLIHFVLHLIIPVLFKKVFKFIMWPWRVAEVENSSLINHKQAWIHFLNYSVFEWIKNWLETIVNIFAFDQCAIHPPHTAKWKIIYFLAYSEINEKHPILVDDKLEMFRAHRVSCECRCGRRCVYVHCTVRWYELTLKRESRS